MLIKDDKLKAVCEPDLAEFLTRLDLINQFNAGELICHFCNVVVTEKNLYAFIPNDGAISLCCINASCVIKLNEVVKK